MSTALWTPSSARVAPKVRPEHEVGTRQWEHNVLSMMHATGGVLDHWNTELRKIDRNLRLMQATENAAAPGVMAGFYHLVRLRDTMEGTFMWVQPLRGPNGEFIEPTSMMLDALRGSDLQNASAVYDRKRADERNQASILRQRENDEDDRIREGIEHFKAVTRTQVLMSSDVPWSQNNSANARRARGEAAKAK